MFRPHLFIKKTVSGTLYFRYLLTSRLNYWSGFFKDFSEAIRLKIIEKGGPIFPPYSFRVAAFIDCTVIATCRPGGGPADAGVNAPRFNTYIQMAVYNGWKKHHGVKFQAIEGPNGMCLHMYGPRSFRQSDLELFAESNIDQLMANAQLNQQQQYCIYGDGIYCITNYCLSNSDPIMTKARISNEWDYGQTANLFSFCKFKCSNKLMQHKDVGKYYFVATILRNCHNCLYDGITASYYELSAPNLKDYFINATND